MTQYRDCAGRIGYRTSEREIGRESFCINRRNGHYIVRAYCEMDEKSLIRDASWSMNDDWQPLDGHVRITLGDTVSGSAWYHFDGEGVDCEGFTTASGRISQRITGQWRYLGLHPLIGDGYIAAARGTDAVGVERPIESITCSYSPDGETGLMALPITIGVTFVGEESVTVPAGTFRAWHYALRWQPDWPPADLWVMADSFILLRLTWPMVEAVHELDRFEWKSHAAL